MRAFAWTVAIELPIYGALLRGRLGVGLAVAVGVLLQVLTHPALWYLFPRFSPYWAWVLVAESCVVAAEAVALAAVLTWAQSAGAAAPPARGSSPWGYALRVALVANVTSTCVGLLVL